MKKNCHRWHLVSFFLAAVFGLNLPDLMADGFIIPRPRPGETVLPLSVRYHRVEVEIRDQVAKTSIDQVFVNNHHRDIEGIFIFPLPEKAAISEFSMFIGDKEVRGEVLDRDKARKIYEDIVRQLRDPALLEYVGRNMFRARVYPIPAQGEKRIKLSYTEVLRAEGSLVKYVYPLDTERFSHDPIQQVAVSVLIQSKIPVSNVYSSSHRVSLRKENENRVRLSFEEENVKPDKDFILYYSFSRDEIGLSLLNWKGPEDSYFMLLASPVYAGEKEKVINKNLVFVLDSSGSMSGEKIKQAKEACRFVLNHLDKNDRFSVVDFDDGVDVFSTGVIPAGQENIQKALSFVDRIEDSGGTNINEALLKALEVARPEENKPNYILFLTDGLPTVGITDTGSILENIHKANARQARIFVFGVGYDVNTELLDRISNDNRGTSVYVGEKDNLEVAISNFYEKISSPLLSDLRVDFAGIRVRDVFPRALPDLFKGSQLVLVGRYEDEGPLTVTLSGKVKDEVKNFVLKSQELAKGDVYAFLERIWAVRRIGYLLEEIRLYDKKAELVEEVKRLGLKFGIITPYTSFLVTEKERRALDAAAPEAEEALAAGKVTGKGAVQVAKVTQSYKAQDQAVEAASQQIRYQDHKTFFLKDGVWVDSAYREGDPVKEIKFAAEEYFQLLSEKPGIGKYLSVGREVIICYQNVNYRIVS